MKQSFLTEALRSPILTLALCALPMAGCQGLAWANLAALVVTVALFFGTLQLRRPTRAPSTSSATTSRIEGQVATATASAGHAGALKAPGAKPIARG